MIIVLLALEWLLVLLAVAMCARLIWFVRRNKRRKLERDKQQEMNAVYREFPEFRPDYLMKQIEKSVEAEKQAPGQEERKAFLPQVEVFYQHISCDRHEWITIREFATGKRVMICNNCNSRVDHKEYGYGWDY